jgi:hypothetical protein
MTDILRGFADCLVVGFMSNKNCFLGIITY